MINREKQIEEYVEKIMFYQDIPGMAIVVTNKDEIIYKRGIGVSNISTHKLITENTIFHTASVTKLFVATGIMQLVEKGKIYLEKPITYYLPDFYLKDDRYKEITVLQLLSHTSGMPDCDDYGWEKPQYDEQALERYVNNLRDIQFIAEPGKKFHYSNIGYEVLGHLIQKVSETSFETYIKEEILAPLGMGDSTLLFRGNSASDVASPHTKDQEKKVIVSAIYPYNRCHAPSSTLTSNIIDMGKWAMANLNRGVLNGNRILKDESYDLLWSPLMEIKKKEEMIGLGWFITKQGEYYIMGHEGSDIGFRSSFGIMPKGDLGVGVFANVDNVSTRRAMRAIFDILLGIEPKKL